MTKQEAIDRFGDGNASLLARRLNITPQAVSKWPEVLHDSAVRRLHAYAYVSSRKPCKQTEAT